MRYFLELAYNGVAFNGWQIQNNAISVQEVINKALNTLLKASTETTGCGRTDTGVHASQFYLHFDTVHEIANAEKFCYQLNAILPDEIAVYRLISVADNAHARFDATSRSYRYVLTTEKSAFMKNNAWYWRIKPDLNLMNEACRILMKYKDFSSFAKAGGQQMTNICEITGAQWISYDAIIEFHITANRFLRGMVRALTGTMLEVGQQKLSLPEFEKIIQSGKRSEAGESVPAHGLYLNRVCYPYITPADRRIFIKE